MNRTKKYCVYRDCNTNSVSNPDLTLFQFPKNEQRAAKWCELGAVDPFETRARFMCELHFPQIYMCFSARRKMLLNTAIPRSYGTNSEENNSGPEQVQSSSYEMEEVPIEEHLEEDILEESDDLATEIIYVDQMGQELGQRELGKRSRPVETPSATKLMKSEKLSSTPRSMVVSSSSTKVVAVSKNPLALTPPQGTILRKVKLKKRPTITTKTLIVKTVQPSSIAQEVVAEIAVSSSPKEKPSAAESDVKEDAERASPAKATTAAASSSISTAITDTDNIEHEEEQKKPQTNKSPVKKDEAIYEFIFKGEEYIQLPKAKYYSDRKKLEMQLDQSVKLQERLRKKVDYYRRSLKDLQEFLNNVCEEDNDDDD